GDGAGVVYSTLGSSHQCTEDIAVLRALPHMAVLSPSDRWEMSACMGIALTANRPVYLRIGKADLGDIHLAEPHMEWGEVIPVRYGNGPLAWIGTGSMVHTAVRLAERWPDSAVYSAPCLKPLDSNALTAICRRHQAIISLEEHSVHGGLGSAISEIATAN